MVSNPELPWCRMCTESMQMLCMSFLMTSEPGVVPYISPVIQALGRQRETTASWRPSLHNEFLARQGSMSTSQTKDQHAQILVSGDSWNQFPMGIREWPELQCSLVCIRWRVMYLKGTKKNIFLSGQTLVTLFSSSEHFLGNAMEVVMRTNFYLGCKNSWNGPRKERNSSSKVHIQNFWKVKLRFEVLTFCLVTSKALLTLPPTTPQQCILQNRGWF